MEDFEPDSLRPDSACFINGEFVDGGGEDLAVHRPSDGKLAAVFREADADTVDRAVRAARAALRQSAWGTRPPRERARVLRRWADLVDAHRDEIARLESWASSRPITEAAGRDIPVVAELLRFYGECADKTAGQVFETPGDVYSWTQHDPYGVVAAIAPWNVPLLLAAAKFAPALAAGNAVVLKPSELTPFSALRLAALAVQAGLPAGLFSVLVGRGPVTGTALVRHPDVAYVTFTGSTATGAAVMCDAALYGMKPVSLELGGKSPQLVFADAPDLDRVADMVASSITRNSGQICFCGSRLVVQRSIADDLVERVALRLRACLPGPTWQAATTLPPIISAAQAARIEGLVDEARNSGGQMLAGGRRFERGAATYFEPTIIAGLAPDSEAIRNEVFGPVLAVQPFDDYEEGLQLADHPVYGLSAGIHTRDIDKALAAARRVEAGTIWINSYGRGDDLVSPFGGYKQSGFGKDFGIAGFEKYRRTKNVSIRLQPPAGTVR